MPEVEIKAGQTWIGKNSKKRLNIVKVHRGVVYYTYEESQWEYETSESVLRRYCDYYPE